MVENVETVSGMSTKVDENSKFYFFQAETVGGMSTKVDIFLIILFIMLKL